MHRDGEHGFSLLETIIALVILAMALITLFEAYGMGLRSISSNSHRNQASLVAQSLLAQVVEPASPGVREGRHGRFHWRIVIQPATIEISHASEPNAWQMFDVVATVSWRPEHRLVLRTLRIGGAR